MDKDKKSFKKLNISKKSLLGSYPNYQIKLKTLNSLIRTKKNILIMKIY